MQGKETAKDEEAIPMTRTIHVTPMSFRLDESHLIHTVETDEVMSFTVFNGPISFSGCAIFLYFCITT